MGQFYFYERWGGKMSLHELGYLFRSSRTLTRGINVPCSRQPTSTHTLHGSPLRVSFCVLAQLCWNLILSLEKWFSTLAASHFWELLRIPMSRPNSSPVKSVPLGVGAGHPGLETSSGTSNLQPRPRAADLKGNSRGENKTVEDLILDSKVVVIM